jgi:hypothetical protein
VGSVITPRGAFRAGFFAGGGINFTPRLLNDVAWLLSAALGENPVTSVDTPVAGVNRHRWTIDGSEDTLFWGTVRQLIPGTSTLGIEARDNKVTALRLVIPQSGLVQGRVDWVGRLFNDIDDQVLFEDPSWTPAFEDFETVPVSTKGGVVIAGLNGSAELPVVGIAVEISNAVTTPQQEMIVGSWSPDDFAQVARTLTYRTTVKWSNPDDYQRVVGGAASATDMSESVFEGAVTVETQAPGVITGATPYELEISSPNVIWQMTAPRLAGANIIMTDLVGTAIKKGSDNYMLMDLFTDSADGGLAWPT